ncbi:MAG: hypothetical protein RMJ51_06660 [Candidatus Calescibacterium sp.]|nr:hypothetical protein [Candidatus Calescibacterium sp.]MCX7758403.1 hypothetical protein [bacterium]MDW8195897.1 hypothetical protein [Candidatus Calescibacterium sp.]
MNTSFRFNDVNLNTYVSLTKKNEQTGYIMGASIEGNVGNNSRFNITAQYGSKTEDRQIRAGFNMLF